MKATAQPTTKSIENFGLPWENAYGYAQAVRVGDVVYVSGQLSHDEAGRFIGPAPADAKGRVTDGSNMELQMRATYENAARLLQRFGATLDNVVEETIYAVDFEAAFAVAGKVRRAAYGSEHPRCASTMVGTTRLAFPEQLVEISFTAVLGSNDHPPFTKNNKDMTSQVDLMVPIGPYDHVLGAPAALLDVVEYGDFQCPVCRAAVPAVRLLLEKFGDVVKFAYRHYPAEEVHPYALCAAEAAECAGAQGRFWEMHQLLFDNQAHLDRRSLHRYAESLGLDMARYRFEMDGGSYRQRIRGQMEAARRSGLRSSPGFFVDRRVQDTSFGIRSLFDATNAALRRHEAA